MKKTLARLLIISIFVSGVYFLKPSPKAQALFGIGDISFDPSNLIPNIGTLAETVYQTVVTTVLEVQVQKLADRVLDKLVNDTLSWANNGFDGEPGFINNWGHFLKGTEHEVISGAFSAANEAVTEAMANSSSSPQCIDPGPCDDQYLNDFQGCIYQLDPIEDEEAYQLCEETRDVAEIAYEQCFIAQQDYLACQNGTSDPGSQAEQNYDLWMSGTLDSSRGVAETVARFGAQRLNYDPLDSLINGEGETLSKILGSQEAKDAFGYDFAAGGIMGYIALADPHNTALGRQALVESSLLDKTNEKVSQVVEETQATTLFLNKTECAEDGQDGTCERQETTTPRGLVEGQVNNSLSSEQEKTINADGLVSSLLQAVGDLAAGLTQQGFSKLTSATVGTFFDQGTSNSEFGGEYQSSYDILGISSDVDITEGIGITDPGNPGNLGGNDIDLMIGGPEHESENYGTQPQIIISLEADLEKNLNYLSDEKEYYEGVRELLIKSQDVLYEFDKCIPGPDYGWEQRYQDTVILDGGQDENAENRLGLNEQKNMIQDPKVTIPGGTTMLSYHQSTLDGIQNDSSKNKIRLDKINNSLSVLEYIKQSVREDFNQQKQAYNNNLVLFKSDWDELDNTQKAEALQTAEQQGYFLNPGDGLEPLTDNEALAVVQSEESRAATAVIATSWNIWRDETDSETKLDLRKSYYVTIPNLSSEEFVAIAKIQTDQTKQNISGGYEVALDCMVFKLYALGISREDIAEIVFDSSLDIEDKVLNAAEELDQLGWLPYWKILNPGFNTFRVNGQRNDQEIISFLNAEYDLKQQNNPSVFATYNMINPEAIEQSILGFDTVEEIEEYGNLYYPTDNDTPGLPSTIEERVETIYALDRVVFNYPNFFGGRELLRGILFCRIPGGTDVFLSSNGCWKDYYIADPLDYQLFISSVNQ